MIVNFVNYDKNFCDLSWKWLNDSEIKTLTMSPDFTKESQNKWFEGLQQRNDYLIWGIECDNTPIGVVGIKNIDFADKTGEYFGYIGEKEYWSKGIGKLMMEYSVKKMREQKLEKLYLKVLNSNERAINLYLKKGFQIEHDTGEYLEMSMIVKENDCI